MIRLAFAFLLSLCVSAQAQLNGGGTGFPGPGMPAASAVTFAITFGSSQEDATGQSSYSIANVGFGAADPNRYGVAVVCIRAGGTPTTPTVTINGAATTKIIDQQTSGSYAGIFQTNAPFTSGTTATVALTSFGVTAARAAVQGYSVVTSTGTLPSGGAIATFTPSGTNTSASITVPSNGASILAACTGAVVSPVSVTAPAANVTIDKNAVIGASSTTTFSAHDTVTRSGATTYTLASSATWNLNSPATVGAAWAP